MNRLHKAAKDLKLTLIGDEHYRFLSHPSNMLGETLYRPNKSSFVTGSFIKCLGSPGLRIGWCVGPTKALAILQNEKNYTTHTVNPITEWISYEVLKDFNTPLFQNMKEEWQTNKTILKEFLATSQKIYGTEPAGGLVTALGFKYAKSLAQTNLSIRKLQQCGVFVLPLSTMEFGKFSFQKEATYKEQRLCKINKGYGFRLGLGCHPEKFKKALKIIEQE